MRNRGNFLSSLLWYPYFILFPCSNSHLNFFTPSISRSRSLFLLSLASWSLLLRLRGFLVSCLFTGSIFKSRTGSLPGLCSSEIYFVYLLGGFDFCKFKSHSHLVLSCFWLLEGSFRGPNTSSEIFYGKMIGFLKVKKWIKVTKEVPIFFYSLIHDLTNDIDFSTLYCLLSNVILYDTLTFDSRMTQKTPWKHKVCQGSIIIIYHTG